MTPDMGVDPRPPPFFTLPREIRNRIYFWLVAKELNFEKTVSAINQKLDFHKQIRFSSRTHHIEPDEISRGQVASHVLANPDILGTLPTCRTFMMEFMEELAIASALPPSVDSGCPELHIYGVGSGSQDLLLPNLFLIELFLRFITPKVPYVYVHLGKATNKTTTLAMMRDHFRDHGAMITRRDQLDKLHDVLKMQIRGSTSGVQNWVGQTVMLTGDLNDFVRSELKMRE